MAAALRASDTERLSSIATTIERGAGANHDPAGIAEFLAVPAEQAWEAWCRRVTNGIADGKLMLVDVNGLSEGKATDNARKALTIVSKGK